MSTYSPAQIPTYPKRPSFAAIDINTMTSAQLARIIGSQTKVQYKAIFIHCLLFDSVGKTLLLRHPNPLINNTRLHKANANCSPHVTCAFWGLDMYAEGAKEEITNSIADLITDSVPSRHIPETLTLLCALSTKVCLTGDGTQHPALVLAAVVQRLVGDYLSVSPALCSDSAWATEAMVLNWKGGCKAMCRRIVLAEAVKQWMERGKAFDQKDGAWLVGSWDGEESVASSG